MHCPYNGRMQKPLPIPPGKDTVIVGMSGGVDSAVAALLLRDAGYAVQGLFMSNWEDDDGYCTTAADFQDARRVCDILGIALHRVSFAEQYRERVFSHFLREYAAGRTPNPDVLCNREIKFGVCLDYMQRLGAAWMATGHYAQVRHTNPYPQLLKAADTAKDQSYFLHSVAASALSKTLFPLGSLVKAQVRRMAHAAGLPVFDKPDSTGICFIGERPFQAFLSQHLRTDPGPVETAEGRIVGEHKGLALYTLGQRSGLNIGGRAGAAAAPWYVADKVISRNALVVVQDQNHPLLMSDAFTVEQMQWINPSDAQAHHPDATSHHQSSQPVECAVKTRYRQNDLGCSLRSSGDECWHATLNRPARSVTPGQYAVFYRGERCLGGGIIARRFNSELAPAHGGINYNSLLSVEGS
jgi:tRNA-specific 2-thiouridylase